MATIQRKYVFASCILAGIAVLFSLISLGTEQWVVTDSAKWVDQSFTTLNTIKYGLFQGTHSRLQPTQSTVQLTMTCIISENACAMLCSSNEEERVNLLRQMINNNSSATQDDSNCPSVQRAFTYENKPISKATRSDTEKKFINSGLWISTIFFLALSVIFGVLSCALAMLNTVSNPVQVYFSIFGLYIYNAVALCSIVMTLILWGALYAVVLFHDIGIYYTLAGTMTSDKLVSLGYSYWILIIPLCTYAGNIALLFIRQYLISKDPGHKIVQREDNADPAIYLY